MPHIKFAGRRFNLPRSRSLRVTIGGLFVVGGMFGFLPILGFWMIPVGLLIWSVDIPSVRRYRRRLDVRWFRWRARVRARKTAARAAKEAATQQ